MLDTTRVKGSEARLASLAEAILEVHIPRLLVGAAGVDVHPPTVHLPDLHQGVTNRVATHIEDTPPQMRDLPRSRRNRVTDNDQIVIGVQGQSVRIERPCALPRCPDKLFGEHPGGIESHSPKCDHPQKVTPAPDGIGGFHTSNLQALRCRRDPSGVQSPFCFR